MISNVLLQAIDNWVFKTPGLRTLLLNEDEWKILGEIADVLEVRAVTPHMWHASIAYCYVIP
jgi:hypothetical protein